MNVYRTNQGEMIDAICKKIYGRESGNVEAVLQNNPGLASLPDPLPIGTVIVLPEQQTTVEREVVVLWD